MVWFGIFAIPRFVVDFRSVIGFRSRCVSAEVRECVTQPDPRPRSSLSHFRTFALTHSRTHALTHSRTHALPYITSFTTAISSHACSLGQLRQSAHTFSGNISLGTVR